MSRTHTTGAGAAETRQPDAFFVTALEENLWSMWSNFGRAPGCALYERPDALWFDTPIASLPYNAVLKHTVTDGADRRIDKLFAHYRTRGVPFFWLVHPSAEPADLERKLEARGFAEAELCYGMVAERRSLPSMPQLPGNIEIREVAGPPDDAALIELIAWRWGVPADAVGHLRAFEAQCAVGRPGSATRAWIAEKDGFAVAKAVTHEAAGVIGLYGVATKPEARGLGLARAICTQALLDSMTDDGTFAVLHATPMARRLYLAMGFREVAPFKVYTTPGSFHL